MFKFKFYTSQDSRNYRYMETIDNIIDFNSSAKITNLYVYQYALYHMTVIRRDNFILIQIVIIICKFWFI